MKKLKILKTIEATLAFITGAVMVVTTLCENKEKASKQEG